MLAAAAQNRVLLPPMTSARRPAGAALRSLGGATMGTTWSVKMAAPAVDLAGLDRAVRAVLGEVVGQMSPWEPGSDLCRFNRAAAGTWVTLPAAFAAVLDAALALAADTDGAFDPTVGALTELWGFGVAPRAAAIPDPADVDRAAARGGWRRLRRQGERLLQPGGVALDLCGVAKGYAVDRLAQLLLSAGVENFLVEIGGELRGAGLKPDGEPWWVELEPPPGHPAEPRTLLAALGVAVATSGGYRRFFDHEGRRYSHTLDPRLGAPVAGEVESVSVVHAHCLQADALATALLVMDAAAGLDFCRRHDLAALFRLRRGSSPSEVFSPALAAML